MSTSKKSMPLKLAESAIMIALATILSFIKLLDLPYGGAITIASMLPIVIISIRYGTLWGMFSGLTYGAVQFVLGISILKYATSAASAVAIILLDYIFAFAFIGLSGLAKKIKSQPTAFGIAALIACLARYLCHVISGATVWAGISIPTKAAIAYSLGYNATYMFPESLILILAAIYIASLIDFRNNTISVINNRSKFTSIKILSIFGISVIAVSYDIVGILGNVQNPDTGALDFSGLANVSWNNIAIVSVIAILVIVLVSIYIKLLEKKRLNN